MANASVTLSASGLRDLRGIRDWYEEEGVSGVGSRLVAEIFTHIHHLAENPDLGRIVPEFQQRFLRELIHPPFRIVYRRDPERVRVVRVWRSERRLRLPPDAGE
jgi:plasmid stabilization system protein ParE